MTFKEKRSFVRIPFWFVAKYRSLGSGKAKKEQKPREKAGAVQEYKSAYGKDLSAGGILIETEEHFPLSTRLELVLNIPSLKEPVLVRGKVVRTYEIEEGKLYDNGIAFEKIDDRYQDTIKRFIELFK